MAGAFLSHQDMVDLLRRTTDEDGWLNPILDGADGAAALGALIEVCSRGSLAADRVADACMISTASGGAPGTAVLELVRDASGTGGAIPRGYRFRDARGAVLILQVELPVVVGALALTAPVETLRQTESVNTEDDADVAVDPEAGVSPDDLGTTALIAPEGDPAFVATTFRVGSSSRIQGGALDWLSMHGRERGQERQAGEDTASYRARVRNVPDAVSPRAVGEAVQAAISRVGLPPFETLEPFDDGAEAEFKDPPGLSSFDSTFADDGFLDDPLTEMVDRRSATAYFRVEPTTSTAIVLLEPLDLFFDVGYFDDPVSGFLAGDSTLDPRVMRAFLAIVEDVEAKRGAGVNWDLFVAKPTQVNGVGFTALHPPTQVWQVFAPAGGGWYWLDGWFGHDFSRAPQPASGLVPGSYHQIVFHFTDATTFALEVWFNLEAESWSLRRLMAAGMPFKPIASVEGFASSFDAVHPTNLVGSFNVIELLA